jgi:hypothetical protein
VIFGISGTQKHGKQQYNIIFIITKKIFYALKYAILEHDITRKVKKFRNLFSDLKLA